MKALLARLSPARVAELFALSNLAFLGVDIAIAHRADDFARPAEWIPIGFSAFATVALLPGLFGPRWHERWRAPTLLVGALSVVVGVAGMIFHLESGFFRERTLRSLVYAAPFAAPLSYVGIGLLVMLLRLEPARSPAWPRWVLLLALGGFVGNFALSLTDHAQNAFFSPAEWIGVVAAAFATSFLLVAFLRPGDRSILRVCLGVVVVEALVGLLGFVLHWRGILEMPGTFAYRVVFGPPAFAPLLFSDLAGLAGIGLWAALSEEAPAEDAGDEG